MSRLKILILILVLIPVIVIGAILILLANPEYYRDQLRSTVKEQSGFELDIKGEMKWRYWPPIALSISDVDVTPAGKTESLAGMKNAAIDVALLPLLFGSQEISIKGLSIDGLTVNAVVDKNGAANWEVEAAAPAEDESSTEPDGGTGLSIDIGGVAITNSIINYRDHSAEGDYTIEIPRLETGPIRFDTPTRFNVELSVADNAGGMAIDFETDGTITFDAAFNRIDTAISGTLGAPGAGNTNIEGALAIDMSDKLSLVFDLALDQIDPGPYLGQADSTATPPAGPAEDLEVLPVATLNDFDIDGVVTIGTVTYETYQFTNVVLDIANGNQELVADMKMQGYDGSMQLVFTGSTRASGAGHTKLDVAGIDLTKLAGFESLTGILSLQSNTTFTGTMLSSVMDTLDGATTFSIKDGTLDVRPVKMVAVAVDALRGKNSGIGVWPDLMPFANMEGQHRFVAGTQDGQTFGFVLENMTVNGSGGFDYFSSTLDYELALVLSETSTGQFRVAPGLAGIEWPLHCKGSFDQSPADLCRADERAVEKILTSLAKDAVTDKALEKIGVENEDGLKEKAKGLLKGLFRRDG